MLIASQNIKKSKKDVQLFVFSPSIYFRSNIVETLISTFSNMVNRKLGDQNTYLLYQYSNFLDILWDSVPLFIYLARHPLWEDWLCARWCSKWFCYEKEKAASLARAWRRFSCVTWSLLIIFCNTPLQKCWAQKHTNIGIEYPQNLSSAAMWNMAWF